MPNTPLLPLPKELEIISISETETEVVVRVTSQRATSCCTVCGVSSSAIHSYYRRNSRYLPCAGRPLCLLLTVKELFCREATCSRNIFV